MKPVLNGLRVFACPLVALILLSPACATAAQRAFFVYQSPSTETVPGGLATNLIVTLTYSNASGTINNAVFTNGVFITPSGQGVTASLSQFTSPIASGGGTGTLPLNISASAGAVPGSGRPL